METFFKKWLASWTGGNADSVLKFYHSDVFYSDPAFPNGIQGKEALGNYLSRLLRRYPDWRWELVSSDQAGERYFVKWKVTLSSGKTALGLDIVEIKKDLIIKNEVYFDPSVLIKITDNEDSFSPAPDSGSFS